jgi:hypothetical protein
MSGDDFECEDGVLEGPTLPMALSTNGNPLLI